MADSSGAIRSFESPRKLIERKYIIFIILNRGKCGRKIGIHGCSLNPSDELGAATLVAATTTLP